MRASRIINLLPMRKGHFRLESGHHGDVWIDLELLFTLPKAIEPFAREIASRLRAHHVEVICGPLVEGSFVAMMVASRLDIPFTYAERIPDDTLGGAFAVRYRVPGAQAQLVAGKRVAIVNDVINAGSAVRGTLNHLVEAGATVPVVAALAVLGTRAAEFAQEKQVALEALATLPNDIWEPAACPLCQGGVPLAN